MKDYFDNDIKIGDHVLTLNNVGRQGIELYFGIVVRMTGQRIQRTCTSIATLTETIKLVMLNRHRLDTQKRLVVLKHQKCQSKWRETLKKIEAYISDMD